MIKKVIVEISVDDSLETACSEQCDFLGRVSLFCNLFMDNVEYIDNHRHVERCKECLSNEVKL